MSSTIKVLVCGGTGFVGRNMVEYFSEKPGVDVHAVFNVRTGYDLKNVTWHRADLTQKSDVDKLITKVRPDRIIQAAATTSGSKDIVSRPYIHVTDNAVMNSYVFRAAAEHHVRHVIFFSCTVMYQSSSVPIKETDYDANLSLHPKYFGVANTKLYLEKMCEFYSSISNTKFTAVRHSNVFGPHDKFDLEKSHFFGANVSKVMTSIDQIILWGSGEEQRDLLHVSDLSRFVDLAFAKQKQAYRMYHCGYGVAYSVLDVVKMIISASGKDIEIHHDYSKPTIKTSLALDCSLAFKELGWKPNIALRKGIENTIVWWSEKIDPNTLSVR